MSERLHTLLLALAALAMLYLVFVPKPAPRSVEFARPLSTETRPDGLAAAARWLAAENVPVHAFRTRFRGLLDSTDWPATGNVLVTHVPHALAMRDSEARPLTQWIERGNTLVVAVALSDTPGWAQSEPFAEPPATTLATLSGLDVEVAVAEDAPRAPATDVPEIPTDLPTLRYDVPRRTTLRPLVEHPLLAGVREVIAVSDYPTDMWRASDYSPVRLALADARAEPPSRSGVGEGLWVLPRGAGRVIVVGVGSAFTNRVLGTADNALLFERLVVASLGAGGAVLFDDAHQGASSLYTPAAFATDPRLWWSVAIVVALWFAWALGVQRLAVPPEPARRPGEDVLVRGAAGHFARRGGGKAAAARMLAHFGARHGVPAANDADAWERLAARHPGAGALVAEVRALAARVRTGRRVDVRRLRRTLQALERIAK